jgi:kynurenine 3-monooxygenase
MKNITIVGGGLVGSLLAYVMAKRGYNIKVFERRPDMRKMRIDGGRSINLVISHRGWTSLEKAGIAEAVKPITVPAYGRMTHDVDGTQHYYPYSIHNKAIYSVSRGELNKRLMDLADPLPNVRYFYNQKCVDVDLDSGTTWFKDYESGETTEVKADLVVGSDGAYSAIRGKMMSLPRFNYSQQYIEHGYKEMHIPAAADGGPQLDLKALHIWPRKQFMLMGLANLDNGFTGTLFFPYEGEESFESIKTEADVETFFTKYFPDAIPLISDYKEQYFDNPTSPLVIIRCSPWHYKSKVMLIGDASHAIVPFYGEGMNAGFEDVKVFTDILDEYSDADMHTVLKKYAEAREVNGNAIADLSLRNFIEMRDLVADPKFILRKKIEANFYKKHPDKWIPLYSQVKFTNIPYIDAWNEGLRQDEIMQPILNTPGIEEHWDSPEIEQMIMAHI